MANYSIKSLDKLLTSHRDLVKIFTYVIRHFDCTILYGHRTPKEQYQLWLKGREDDEDIVTYLDGYKKLSKHNAMPSMATDAVSYPINWKDLSQHYYFAGYVKAVADMLYDQCKITHKVRCGADWNKNMQVSDEKFMDLFHFELID